MFRAGIAGLSITLTGRKLQSGFLSVMANLNLPKSFLRTHNLLKP